MSNAMLDARQEGDSYRRIEVITGQRRRRRWTAQEKARIVAESFEEGANISEVARRHGVVRGLLTVWRHKLASAAGVKAPGFVPVRIASEGGPATAGEPGRSCAGSHEADGDGIATRPAAWGDRDRGERGAHPGRAGCRYDDAYDGAVGAARRPVIALRSDLKVVLAAHPVDFRKSVHTLSALVSEALRANPYCGDVFVFRSKRVGQSEASGMGRQRHGAGDEVAAPGELHLAADPRRSGASECDASSRCCSMGLIGRGSRQSL